MTVDSLDFIFETGKAYSYINITVDSQSSGDFLYFIF